MLPQRSFFYCIQLIGDLIIAGKFVDPGPHNKSVSGWSDACAVIH